MCDAQAGTWVNSFQDSRKVCNQARANREGNETQKAAIKAAESFARDSPVLLFTLSFGVCFSHLFSSWLMMLPNFAPVVAAATLFIQSYNQSMQLHRQGESSLVCSSTIASYYPADSSFIGFWGGTANTNVTQAFLVAGTKQSIDFLVKSGYGFDVRSKNFRVEPYSDDGAAVWVDWNLKPKNGGKDIEWTTMYGYRMRNAQNATLYQDVKTRCAPTGSLACKVAGRDKVQGWFEFTITDNEIKAFSERIPNYLAGAYSTPS